MSVKPTKRGYRVQRLKVRLVRDGGVQWIEPRRVHCGDDVAALFSRVFREVPHEEVWLALLSGGSEVRGLVKVSQGGVHAAALLPVDVLRPVIASGETKFVLAHNHPSGDPTPSPQDIDMTRALLRACRVVDVTCLDHLIVTRDGAWSSLRSQLSHWD